MKTITVKFTEEQIELLESLSKKVGKSSSDVIKETIFALLPFSEYSAIKKYMETIPKEDSEAKNISIARSLIKNIQESANARLKRIGVI